MKIAVAMSGGVDSSAAAAILKEQGHDLVGFVEPLQSLPSRVRAGRLTDGQLLLHQSSGQERLESR